MEKLNTSQSEGLLAWFWDREIKKISYDNLPAWAIGRFEGYSKRFISHREYVLQSFSWLYVVEYNSNEKAYIATQKKVFKKETGDEIHDNIYLYEEKNDGYLWHAEIFLINGESYAQVWFTETKKEFYKQWYGLRRILFLNALAQFFYKKPLASSTLFVEQYIEWQKGIYPSKRIWEKLAQNNIAKTTERNGHNSYIMSKVTKTREAVNSLLWEKI
ncbi:MAG: hypothetical protein ACD_78C00142G0001 [uncultured bacterium (gcode 4)]|uniref:Uncharacterized protein n=1 Tax=uncultured bacterium (gcode 4) TaxID=1234023 RepID=K1YXR5_9BACT|nr:MAG: hypothetical protein ACD_78C00142G0001 [uncultured bacterium (gcode 4)]